MKYNDLFIFCVSNRTPDFYHSLEHKFIRLIGLTSANQAEYMMDILATNDTIPMEGGDYINIVSFEFYWR